MIYTIKSTYILLIISILILLIFLVFLKSYFERNKIKIIRYTIESGKVIKEPISNEFKGAKIVFFSDIHLGRTMNEKSTIKKLDLIKSQNADLYVFGGDLCGNNIQKYYSIDKIKELFSIFNNKHCISIYGNHEFKPEHGINNDIKQKYMDALGFKILNNEKYSFYCNNKEYTVYGMMESIYHNLDYNKIDEKLIFSHEGDVIDKIKNPCVIVSGHTHGGQIKLPLIPIFYKPRLGKKYNAGLYEVDNKKIIVSRGIGCNLIKLRFFSPSDIIVIDYR